MAKKLVQIAPGRQVEGESLRFKALSEPWCEFECEDGSTVRLKVVVSDIVRIDEIVSPEGEPIYVVKSSNILAVDVPDALKRRKPSGGEGVH